MIRAQIGEIELGDLLHSLESNKRNAIISITAPNTRGRIHLRDGRMAYVQTTPGPHLGEYLVRFDYLTLEQVQTLVRSQQQENPGTPLGYLALKQGFITEEELGDVLHAQILEALATLLGLREGELVLEPIPVNASQVLLPGAADTSTMIIESVRRLDEWMRGRVEPEAVLQLVGDPTRHPLSPDAWSVLERVDGLKRARSIALECDLPEEQVYHVLYELTSRGLLSEAEIRPQDPLILVLSDSMLVRRLLLVTLERARYRVLLPQDLSSAKRMLENLKPQGILLEGEAFADKARQLRALPNGRFPPLWVLSDTPPRGLWVRTQRIGHIAKPFSEGTVLDALSVVKRVT